MLLWLAVPMPLSGQTLTLADDAQTVASLTNTTATLSGRAALTVTGTGDPLPGSTIHLNSPDAWCFFTNIQPSAVKSSLLARFRVSGVTAVDGTNAQVVQHGMGAVVIPHGDAFEPLEVFDEPCFFGTGRKLSQYQKYDDAALAGMADRIRSFRLRRGYMATFAVNEDGSGGSRCYVAQDGDLELGRLPAALDAKVSFVRVFPWRWVAKKGVAGNIEANLKVSWLYNWNLDRNSASNWEYVPIRQSQYWPGLDQDWKARGATHVLGFNEPDHTDQANMTVAQAIAGWPALLSTGLRVGAPAVSDGGLSWLYDFMDQADAAGLRVDYVPVHYYRCVSPSDAGAAANQFYNFLKGIYDRVKRPIWITEWNNGANWTGCGDPTFTQQAAAVDAMLDMLDGTPWVERYAVYNWVEDVRRVVWDDGWPTAAGEIYRDNVSPMAYRQEHRSSDVARTTRYRFDGNTHDDGGSGQDAMPVGAPGFTAGKSGSALVLDGDDDYLQIPSNVGNSTDFTFAGWVYWGGGGTWQRVFDLGEVENVKYLYFTPNVGSNTARFTITANGWGGEQRLETAALPINVWTHVAVTIAGDTGKLFINGAKVATNTGMTVNPSALGVKYNYIGHSRFPADPNFKGRLDDLRFLTSALTDAEVAALVAGTLPGWNAATLTAPEAVAFRAYSANLGPLASGGVGTRTIEKLSGPSWLTVSAGGALGGTPGAANLGANRFVVRVTDDVGGTQIAPLEIGVTSVTGLPSTTSASISNSARDAEEAADGTVTLDSTDLELVQDAGPQLVGLRFDLAVPQGAVITDARIQFKADEAQSEATALRIVTEAVDSAAVFTTATRDLSSRVRSVLEVPWQPAAWTVGEATGAQRTPNLAGIVQEVVSRPGWASGNAIAFLVSGTGHRTADAQDKAGGSPAVLTVQFLTPALVQTAAATVADSADDAEQAAAGTVTLNSTDLELVNDGAAGNQIVGLRFTNVAVPPGALIAGADVQFTADEAQSGATSLTLRAQAVDSAPPFAATANNLGSRVLTAAAASWAPAAWTTVGDRTALQRTPDLSGSIQEVVNRPGWTSGNALAILINGTGHRTADAFDKTDAVPATLTIRYRLEIPLGTYERWDAGSGGQSTPMDDIDGDGLNHLQEYAFGLDPGAPDLPVLQWGSEGGRPTVTFTHPVAVLDVGYEVEWSQALTGGTWSTAGVSYSIVADDGTFRTVRAILPATAGRQVFARIKTSR